jgi:hypothetical protein
MYPALQRHIRGNAQVSCPSWVTVWLALHYDWPMLGLQKPTALGGASNDTMRQVCEVSITMMYCLLVGTATVLLQEYPLLTAYADSAQLQELLPSNKAC